MLFHLICAFVILIIYFLSFPPFLFLFSLFSFSFSFFLFSILQSSFLISGLSSTFSNGTFNSSLSSLNATLENVLCMPTVMNSMTALNRSVLLFPQRVTNIINRRQQIILQAQNVRNIQYDISVVKDSLTFLIQSLNSFPNLAPFTANLTNLNEQLFNGNNNMNTLPANLVDTIDQLGVLSATASIWNAANTPTASGNANGNATATATTANNGANVTQLILSLTSLNNSLSFYRSLDSWITALTNIQLTLVSFPTAGAVFSSSTGIGYYLTYISNLASVRSALTTTLTTAIPVATTIPMPEPPRADLLLQLAMYNTTVYNNVDVAHARLRNSMSKS